MIHSILSLFLVALFLGKLIVIVDPSKRTTWQKGIQVLSQYVDAIHLALFYISPKFLNLSNRVCNIEQLQIRRLRKGEAINGYELLGWMIIFQVATRFYLAFTDPELDSHPKESSEGRYENPCGC